MNASASRLGFARRTVVWILACGAASLLVATLVSASQRGTDTNRGGASPYTPSKGEWLCLFLNSRQALVNSERAPAAVSVQYLYDLSKPDTIKIQVLFGEGMSEQQLHLCAARAARHATEMAKVQGWQDWLKIEIGERKVTYLSPPDELIR